MRKYTWNQPSLKDCIKWWLGIAVSNNPLCPFCPSHALDPLGHQALTCKHGGGECGLSPQRDVFLESCQLGPHMEEGSGLGHEERRTQPADILIPHWD